ncbi:MAG: hypothetical protein HOO96_41970 [Polyangiaceae bacterium]|nr:hypothetical protein [Polyangiaceae bacterium]
MKYVKTRLPDDPQQLVDLGKRVLGRFASHELQEALWRLDEEGRQRVSDLTRRQVLDGVMLLGPLSGRLELVQFLKRVWPLDSMPSTDPRFGTAAADIFQHVVNNDDWTVEYLMDHLEVTQCSEKRFIHFLEEVVHPNVRQDEEQKRYVDAINQHLLRDGLELRATEQVSGYPVYRVVDAKRGVSGTAKNLIFASTGPKPEIILADAINNDIQITKNAEHCLVFDRLVPGSGLFWLDLVSWWSDLTGADPSQVETGRALYKRLVASLGSSPPEQLLFSTYFEVYKDVLPQAPALIPQVYLHFDPLTTRQRQAPVLPRQRMDFLLLLSSYERVVIEVDGKQHYANGDHASPQRYAEMVSADRQLRLDGYEVYRFGGAELMGAGGKTIVKEFFARLFKRHRVVVEPTSSG